MAGLYQGLLKQQLGRADTLSLAQKAAAWDKPRKELSPAERDHTLSNADRAREVHEGAYADQIVEHYSAALGAALSDIYTYEKVLEAVRAIARLKSPPTMAVPGDPRGIKLVKLKASNESWHMSGGHAQEVLKEAAFPLRKIVQTTITRYLAGAGHTTQLKAVVGMLHADSYIAGSVAAKKLLGSRGKLAFGLSTLSATIGLDLPADYWDTWKPGYEGAADLIQRSGGLAQLLAKANQTIMGLQATTITEIGRRIMTGLQAGDPHEKVARDIGDLIRNPARCKTIANTEYNRAMTSASVDTYKANEIEMVRWLAETDCCPLCQANEDQGAVALGTFVNGDAPVHPNCRCAVVPDLDSILLNAGVSGFTKELKRVLKGWDTAWETELRGPNGEWLAGIGGAAEAFGLHSKVKQAAGTPDEKVKTDPELHSGVTTIKYHKTAIPYHAKAGTFSVYGKNHLEAHNLTAQEAHGYLKGKGKKQAAARELPKEPWGKGGTKLSDDAARAAILQAMTEQGIRHKVGDGLYLKKTATPKTRGTVRVIQPSYDVVWTDAGGTQHTVKRVTGSTALDLLKGDHPLRTQVEDSPMDKVDPLISSSVPRLLNGPATRREAAAAVNPAFAQNHPGNQINCQMCVTAYEMQRRGLGAKAKPVNGGQAEVPTARPGSGWMGWLGISHKTPVWVAGAPAPWYVKGGDASQDDLHADTATEAIANEVSKWPVGARGVVQAKWKEGGAHVLNVENTPSGVVFVDAQSGAVSTPEQFGQLGGPGQRIDIANVARVDDKVIPAIALQALTANTFITQHS